MVLQMILVSVPFAAAQDSTPAGTSDCITSDEPNDEVEDALELGSGEVCASAGNPVGGQDLYLWTVDPDDATTRWTITVSAIPGQLTIIEPYLVEFDDVGTVISATNLASVGGGVDGATVLRDTIFPTGVQLVIGVATSGPGAYIVTIEPGTESPEINDTEPNDDTTTATGVGGEFALSGDHSGSFDVIAWTLTEDDAASEWTLALQKPLMVRVNLELTREDGTSLAVWQSNDAGIIRIPNLGLTAGTYYLNLPSSAPEYGPYILEAIEGEPLVANAEIEPNDLPAGAVPIALTGDSTVVTGNLDAISLNNDRDVFRITISPDQAGRQLDIRARWEEGASRRFCLLDAIGTELRCEENDLGVAFDDLVLPAGDFYVAIGGAPAQSNAYVIRFDITREADSGFEAEPNDTKDTASKLVPDGDTYAGSGRLEGQNPDFFVFTVAGEPQLWQIEVTGPGVQSVGLVDVTGTAQATGNVENGVAILYDMFLLPGDQRIVVQGDSDVYQIMITPLGPPDPLAELEPNNSLDSSQAITLLETHNGRLPKTEDADYYRFSLQNDGYARIGLTSPGDAQFTVNLTWQGRSIASLASPAAGEAIEYDAWLLAGDYQLQLGASVPSLERYELQVSPLDPFTLPLDLEPNDAETSAIAVDYGQTIEGVGSSSLRNGDRDWYLLPALDDATQATVTYPENVSYQVYTAGVDGSVPLPIYVVPGTEAGSDLADLPAETPILIAIDAIGPYEVTLQLIDDSGNPQSGGSPEADIAATSDLEVSLALGDGIVAAYWRDGQRLDGAVEITNAGDDPVEVSLDAWTGNYAWTVVFDEPTLAIDTGETVSVPVQVHVAPDAWADRPILIYVRASGATGFATGSATVTVDRVAPPINPTVVLPLPPELLGGLNVAWTGLGSVPDATALTPIDQLFDQLVTSGGAYNWRTDPSSLPQDLMIDLAGDEPVPLAGFILDPRGSAGIVMDQVRDFEVLVSTDGVDFTQVYAGSMSGAPTEQAFVFDEPIEAMFVQLRVLSAQSPDASEVVLGEFKVIAEPGWSLVESDVGPNLGDPLVGGHVVDLQPPMQSIDVSNPMLTDDDLNQQFYVAPGTAISWVIGFHQDRAAQIERLTWQDMPAAIPEQQLTSVTVEVAVGSPIGPWTALGVWELDRDGSGLAEYTLDTPTWARFVRFTTTAPGEPGDDAPATYWDLPDAIAIYERSISEDYRSILGEWGGTTSNGIYEILQPVAPIELDDDAGNDQESATLLPLGTTITNTAWVEQDVDWYRIDVPNDAGALAFTVTGFPSLDVTADLFDAAGDRIEFVGDAASPGETGFNAPVDPGQSYYLRVTEPPSNVIFAFDTSGSIGPFVTTVYQALGQYAADVQTGQEVVNIVPFGRDVLLPDWSGEPYLLQSALTNYPRTEGSSDADGALLTSMDALAPQDGTKAIVLITDNETEPTLEQLEVLWPQLNSVKPSVFSIQISGSDVAAMQQDIMQDWSAVNSGKYVYVQNQGEMDIAFDRAATILRRPSYYSVTVEAAAPLPTPTPEPTNTPEPTPTAEPTSTPEPTPTSEAPLPDGSIFVSAPEIQPGEQIPAADDLSVAIILDTSGSMLQELEGSTRADIAKESLTELVTETIPPGTNLSLRTFGDEPDSCESRLVVPRAPLDPEAMTQTIADLPIVNLVRTPIGASLEQVGDDLGTSPGPKIVVLVTDGEETCEGDPAAAIQALIDSGIDVRVNIVGFALDDEALKAQFAEWAQIGNGQYIDAGNAEELTAAIAESVQPTYDVIDENGDVIASGQVGGEPIDVPPGFYTVIVRSANEVTFEDVEVISEQETWLELEGR